MRTAIACLLAAALIGACAPANPNRQAGDPPKLEKQCQAVGALAAVVMAARQTGRSRDDVVQSLTPKMSGKSAAPIRALVDVAYKTRLEPTAARKKSAVRSFASYAVTACYIEKYACKPDNKAPRRQARRPRNAGACATRRAESRQMDRAFSQVSHAGRP